MVNIKNKLDITLSTKKEAIEWANKRRRQGLKVNVVPYGKRYQVILKGMRKRR